MQQLTNRCSDWPPHHICNRLLPKLQIFARSKLRTLEQLFIYVRTIVPINEMKGIIRNEKVISKRLTIFRYNDGPQAKLFWNLKFKIILNSSPFLKERSKTLTKHQIHVWRLDVSDTSFFVLKSFYLLRKPWCSPSLILEM